MKHNRVSIEKSDKDGHHIHYISAKDVKAILKKIKPEDARLLGFSVSQPCDLLVDKLVVVPPQVRPSIEMAPDKKS